MRRSMTAVVAGLVATAGLAGVPGAAHANPDGTDLVISEAYGGGGNSGSTYTHDFIELFNPTEDDISVEGWSVQYRPATGSSTAVTPLTGSVPAGGHYLIQQAAGEGGTTPLPTPDAVDSIAMSGTAFQVVLSDDTDPVTVPAGDVVGTPGIVDFLGAGAAAASYEGAAAPAPSNSNSVSRDEDGTDTDVNGDDFTSGAPTPRNAAGEGEPEPPGEYELEIHEIQGTGTTSDYVGDIATTTGVVTAAYPDGGFYGFYLQEPGSGGADLDLTEHDASAGIFVYYPFGTGDVTVEPGNLVEVTGVVGEHAGATQLSIADADEDVVVVEESVDLPEAVSTYPTTDAERETLEGMLFRPTGDFTVTETYATNTFGEVVLAQGNTPLIQPTEVARPGSPQAAAVEADNAARRIILDDGSSVSFTSNTDATPAYISNTAPVRVGAAATFTEDVIFTQGGAPASPTYRFQPRQPVIGPDNEASPVEFENTRTAAPDDSLINATGDADVTVASFNVLNYFTTLGDPDDTNVIPSADGCTAWVDRDGDGNNVNSGCDQRGAWDPEDLERQQEKIVAAINALDADVVGLMEIENSAALGEDPDEATETLVDALNADAGAEVWAANPSSTDLPDPGLQDVITNAIIYQVDSVERVGDAHALGDQSDDGQPFMNAREPLAQAFVPSAGGEPFLVVVNHFKSKGSAGPFPGDTDTGDGQGASNGSRMLQAQALRDWVPTLQADLEVDAVLLTGDFNSYGQEDPLQILYDAGYANVEQHFDLGKWSYNFQALSGSLDHVLANEAALERATGADIWNINSGEAIALEYSRWNYHGTDFHDPGPYRSSDHDPVILGLTAEPPAPDRLRSSTTVTTDRAKVRAGDSVSVTATVTDADGGTPTGTVRFVVDNRTVNATLVDGTATADLGPLRTAGTRVIGVRYLGDDATLPSADWATVAVAKRRVALRPRGKQKVTTKRGQRVRVKARVAPGPLTGPQQVARRLKVVVKGERVPAKRIRTRVKENGVVVVTVRGGFSKRGAKRIRVVLRATPGLTKVRTTFRVRVR